MVNFLCGIFVEGGSGARSDGPQYSFIRSARKPKLAFMRTGNSQTRQYFCFPKNDEARRLGLQTTANAGGAQNLIVPGNSDDMAALIKQMGTGLIVEELIGQGVNPVTGDYSRGAVGHWVENGEIQYPVHEVTIAGNLRDLYGRIAAIGNDQDIRGGIRCGSLLVEEMTVAGD